MAALLLTCILAFQDTLIELDPIPERSSEERGLGTGPYRPREGEKKFYDKVPEAERTTGSLFEDYLIQGRKDKYCSWFGIVRRIATEGGAEDAPRTLTVEHKYFDGLTDTHMMALSFNGSGDFTVTLGKSKVRIEELVLVRVYGNVVDEKDKVPALQAEYVRVWPWKAFTFLMAYGEDRSNPEWRKLNKAELDGIYNPWPDEKYYVERLGKRSKP